jgi:hypothetical protein
LLVCHLGQPFVLLVVYRYVRYLQPIATSRSAIHIVSSLSYTLRLTTCQAIYVSYMHF